MAIPEWRRDLGFLPVRPLTQFRRPQLALSTCLSISSTSFAFTVGARSNRFSRDGPYPQASAVS